ncbi:RNA methyltransferase [Polaribacter sp.]|uniref:TrmH family RNA methyltransferase n=1 Tax=Polaribacter sp. TaxID=1920175 RepID=UPI0025D90878|nr:RNA methyltransferase [Polaribacter sp.]
MFVFMENEKLLLYLEDFLTAKRKATFRSVLDERTRHFSVVLEDIYQPHNASAVFRTCDVFGIQDLHIIENRYINRVSKYVTKGAQKWITSKRYKTDGDNTLACLNHLKENGYQVIATSPHAEASNLNDFNIDKKTAFVFGAEASGISETVKNNADGFLKIPMVGFTESLNISVAAAIILQEVTSKLKKSKIDWQLTSSEKEKIYLNWIRKTIKNVDQIEGRFFKNYQNI